MVSLQRGVEAEYKLNHCIDEEGRGLKPRATEQRKVGIKGPATLLDRSVLLYPVLPRPGARGRLLQTSDGSILERDDDVSTGNAQESFRVNLWVKMSLFYLMLGKLHSYIDQMSCIYCLEKKKKGFLFLLGGGGMWLVCVVVSCVG